MATLHFLSLQPLATTMLLSKSLTTLHTSRKRNHAVFVLLWFISLSIMSSRFKHIIFL